MSNKASMTIAYTPDSDDAFYYFGLETGRVPMPGFLAEFTSRSISELNRAALDGEYEVTAISSVAYPLIADRYAILSVGTSVGRGYGPVLVSRDVDNVDDLRGRRVGVPGLSTTGAFLLRWVCPEAILMPMNFDQVGEAVARGEVAAGVMIHEELLYYPQLGLRRLMDLGAEWCARTELPLPVGINVVRRDLGRANMESICAALRASLEYGLAHRENALDWVSRFGRGKAGRCTKQFVEMFANDDSLHMPVDVRQALQLLLKAAVDQGIGSTVPALDIVEGSAQRFRSKTGALPNHQGSDNG